MSLKADRQVDAVEIGFFLDETATRGVIASISTAGSGIALDPVENIVTIAAASSGQAPIGLLVQDMVDLDLTRQRVNWHKHQVQKGGKVTLVTKGWLVTDNVVSATAGAQAVLASSGYITTKSYPHNEAATPTVGKFRTGADEDGFARVYIDL